MEFVENVATAVDKKRHTVGVFIDLQKAFETIDPYFWWNVIIMV